MADDFILYDQHGRPLFIGTKDPEPQPVIKAVVSNGEAVALLPLVNTAVGAGGQCGYFRAAFTGTAMVMFCVNTVGVSGVLSLIAQTIGQGMVSNTGQLLQGQTISAGQWQQIPISIEQDNIYSLSFSAACSVSIQVTGSPVALAFPTGSVPTGSITAEGT